MLDHHRPNQFSELALQDFLETTAHYFGLSGKQAYVLMETCVGLEGDSGMAANGGLWASNVVTYPAANGTP